MIPTNEQFQSFLIKAHWVPSAELRKEAKEVELDPKAIRVFLEKTYAAKEAHKKAALDHIVVKWFYDQRSTELAMSTLSGRKRKHEEISQDEYLDRKVQSILVSESKGSWGRINLLHEVESAPLFFTEPVLTIFRNYFYTDRWRDVARLGRESRKILEKAVVALKSMQNLRADIDSLEQFHIGYGLLSVGGRDVDGRLARLVDTLEHDDFIFPARRADETAKERVLVFDLMKLFRMMYRADKPTAIGHLLSTEGVRHSLDQRTIEKLLAQWRDKRRDTKRRLQSRK